MRNGHRPGTGSDVSPNGASPSRSSTPSKAMDSSYYKIPGFYNAQ